MRPRDPQIEPEERKKFGALGWNGSLSYEFNDTDFDICQSQLCLYLDKYEKVRIEFIPKKVTMENVLKHSPSSNPAQINPI